MGSNIVPLAPKPWSNTSGVPCPACWKKSCAPGVIGTDGCFADNGCIFPPQKGLVALSKSPVPALRGKLGQERTSFKVKSEQSAPRMSTGMNVPEKTTLHLAFSIETL